MRGLGFKEGGCGDVWVLGIVLEGDHTFCRKGDRANPIILNQWQIDGDKTTA